jgi:hypothetical protein
MILGFAGCEILFGVRPKANIAGNNSNSNNAITDTIDTVVKKITFADLVARFPIIRVPALIPDETRNDKVKVLTAEYLELLVGVGKPFEEKPKTAYTMYARLEGISPAFESLVIAEEQRNGTTWYLCNYQPNGTLIEKREIAFVKMALGVMHSNIARIQKDRTINQQEKYIETVVPAGAAEINKTGIQKKEKNNTRTLQIQPDGRITG